MKFKTEAKFSALRWKKRVECICIVSEMEEHGDDLERLAAAGLISRRSSAVSYSQYGQLQTVADSNCQLLSVTDRQWPRVMVTVGLISRRQGPAVSCLQYWQFGRCRAHQQDMFKCQDLHYWYLLRVTDWIQLAIDTVSLTAIDKLQRFFGRY